MSKLYGSDGLCKNQRRFLGILDVVSPTGSGKTLAYMLPIFDLLKKQ